MKKLIVGSMIALASISQAHAWGDREQGIVTGIAAVLAIQGMTRNQQYPNGQPPVVVGQGPVVMHPQYPVITIVMQEVGVLDFVRIHTHQLQCQVLTGLIRG